MVLQVPRERWAPRARTVLQALRAFRASKVFKVKWARQVLLVLLEPRDQQGLPAPLVPRVRRELQVRLELKVQRARPEVLAQLAALVRPVPPVRLAQLETWALRVLMARPALKVSRVSKVSKVK